MVTSHGISAVLLHHTDGDKYPVAIDSVSIYPDPPKRGRRLSLLAELTLGEYRGPPHHHTRPDKHLLP